MVAVAILIAGVAGSLAAALVWRSNVRTRERESFRASASDVSGVLETTLRRDTDFVRAVRAVAAMEGKLSPGEIREWLNRLEDHNNRQGGYGALVVRAVPARELGAFIGQRDADPAFRSLVGGKVEPVARTGRASYCLLVGGTAEITYSSEVAAALQGDWCDPSSLIGSYAQNGTTRARFTQEISESGQVAVYSAPITPGVSTLIIEAAVYRHGAPIATVAQRRAAVIGWVLGSFDIPALMSSAVSGHHGLSVTLNHTNGSLTPEFIGSVDTGARSRSFTHRATLSLDGTWIISVSGAPLATGPSANLQAAAVLVGGALGSLLLFALVMVLASSRERALEMVRQKTAQLQHQALHDALTDLPNRLVALDRGEQMLARSRRGQLPVAALYIDVDGFKQINDSFGHAAGDELLQLIAQRLQSVVRGGDTAARLGGDEFVVLVEGSTLDAGPELVAERLLEVLRKPYELTAAGDRPLAVTASIGVACAVHDDAEELLRKADIALYSAKAAGRNRYVVFQAGMQTAAREHMLLQLDLFDALDSDQLFLLYQPIFDLRSNATVGAEALLRWRHPTRGIVSPADFIPQTEASGMIVEIGAWVLREACGQAARWHADGYRVVISVNVSPRQLDSDGFIDDVRRALGESGLDPRWLTLEVTETALMRDPDATARRLRRLKDLGVRIAIDDFGTGYSSLSYLRQFPVDALKIDRSFIRGISGSDRSSSLMSTLVALGKALEIETLAEGIEENEQLERLKREHCDHGQGFLFARPLDVESMEGFLRASHQPGQPLPAR
jgi:diguanylate cyclase (GGDEF)-like protein